MKTKRPIFFLLPIVGFWLLAGAGCGDSNVPDLTTELSFERKVGNHFGKWIAERGDVAGTVVVLVSPDAGGMQRKLEKERVAGLRAGLGPESDVVEIPAADPGDPESMMIQNDNVPLGLFKQALSKESNIQAVISLVGFPVFDPVPSSRPPLYLFAVTHQELARRAVRAGWADGVLYNKGADDLPAIGDSGIAVEILQRYGLETR